MSKVYRCTGTDKNKGHERGRGGCKIEWSDREFDIFEELCAKFCDQKERQGRKLRQLLRKNIT